MKSKEKINCKYIIEHDDSESYITFRQVELDDGKDEIFDTFNDAKYYLMDLFQYKINEYEESIEYLINNNEKDYFK